MTNVKGGGDGIPALSDNFGKQARRGFWKNV